MTDRQQARREMSPAPERYRLSEQRFTVTERAYEDKPVSPPELWEIVAGWVKQSSR